MFGKTLADLQLTQAALADMATEIDAAALLPIGPRGARRRGRRHHAGSGDGQDGRHRGRAAGLDRAVQLFGGLGVRVGGAVERLYRGIRPLRIYEGRPKCRS